MNLKSSNNSSGRVISFWGLSVKYVDRGAGDDCSCVVIIGADFKASTDLSFSDFIIHPFGGNLALIQHRLIGLRTLSRLRVFEHSFLACVLGFGCACRELGRFFRLW